MKVRITALLWSLGELLAALCALVMVGCATGCESMQSDPDMLKQDLVFVLGDAAAIAQDARTYLELQENDEAVRYIDQLIESLTAAENALAGGDYDISALADQLRLAWLVAQPFVPDDHMMLAQLIATSVDRVLVRLEWHAARAAEQDAATNDDDLSMREQMPSERSPAVLALGPSADERWSLPFSPRSPGNENARLPPARSP